MAVKKIEELNIHRDVNSTEQFDVQGYLNENWDKMQDVVDNNAKELMQVQKDISTLKEDNKTNKSRIDVLEKSNETRDGKISKNTEDIEAIQGSIKTATETINKKDNEQDEDIKANKESIKEIQAENERLREDIKSIAIQGEANGESIHIEDSSSARCEVEICGNHQQDTREGYNLLNLEKYVYSETISNINGGKIEVSKGIVNLNGTNATARMTAKSKDLASSEYDIIPAGTYFFGVNCNLVPVSGGSLLQPKLGIQELKEDYYLTQWYAICDVNKTESYPLLISKDTQKTKYEQYGASPSFAYPSPVKSVGNIKNILDMSNAKNGASAGIICTTNADGSYKYKGTATSQYINVWFMGGYATDLPTLFTLEPGTYYINDVSLFEGTTGFANDSSKKIWTFIRAYNVTGVRAVGAVSGNTYDETKYPIIAKIDHEIPWVPYNCGSVQVSVQNKNYLANITQSSITENGITVTYDGEKFLCKGTITATYFGLIKQTNIYLPIGTYTFSQNAISQGRLLLRLYYRDGTFSTYYISQNTWKASFTTLKEAIAFRIMCDSLSSGINIDYTMYVQLENGKTNTDWIKPEIQQRIFPVQQPMFEGDKFVKQDKKWYEQHCVKTEIMLTFPTTNIEVCGTFANFQTNRNIAFAVVKNDLKITNVRNDILCDKLKAKDNSMWGGKEDGIQTYINSNKFMISIPFEDIEKNFGEELTINNYSQAFRKYINDNPLKIYYKLAEPELIECTEAQSKVLDEIYSKAHTYKNITNISAESAEVNPIVSLKYLKDVETEHNKLQAQINEIKELLSSTETSSLLLDNIQKDLESEV